MHIYVMYPTPAEPTILVYSIILTHPIVENMSPAKPQQDSNPKLVQRFPLYASPQATAPSNSRCDLAQNGVYKPTLSQKKARFCWCWVHYIKALTGYQCVASITRSVTFSAWSNRAQCHHHWYVSLQLEAVLPKR